ncbi:hypothetical protein RhiirB3_490913 [Rhizophagus irregularis]|nr:hypothetical protein RhiirB3_490913 [Rhizophagus irregularis]
MTFLPSNSIQNLVGNSVFCFITQNLPETNISENEENSEISIPNYEETDDEEVEMTNNKKAKENKDDHEENDEIDNFFKGPSKRNSTNLFEKWQKSDKCNKTDIEKNEAVRELHDDLDTSDHEETADEEEEVVETTDNKKVKENKHFSKTELDEIDDASGSQIPELLDKIVEFLSKFNYKVTDKLNLITDKAHQK